MKIIVCVDNQNGMMFNLCGNEVFLTLLCSKKSSRTNSLVVCFASAGSKVNLIKICT